VTIAELVWFGLNFMCNSVCVEKDRGAKALNDIIENTLEYFLGSIILIDQSYSLR
jgi:hypothetical protein